ncbi:ExbD/TolR family protein [Terricaulis sp.]|uniref:ExbD/TolR family protein n=1 Tax=Terricaulis sp. TaxID=2768686 RepID=UPI003783E081
MSPRTSAAARLAPAADPNVIPFIDVLLVLLIIFMVTAPKPNTDLRVDLPSGGPPAQGRPTIVMLLPDDGGLFVDGEAVTLEGLPAATLAHALANNPDMDAGNVRENARVLVRADLDAAYASVVAVVDELQHARFAKVGVAGEAADEG